MGCQMYACLNEALVRGHAKAADEALVCGHAEALVRGQAEAALVACLFLSLASRF